MISIKVNGQNKQVEDDPQTPLLWVLRDSLDLTGTKYGCGIAQCGACTVLLDGTAVRSCSLPVGSLSGKEITTIEGLAKDDTLTDVQQAWVEEDVPQCGYCQSGQIMNATSLLTRNSNPSDEEIESAMSGNICRCGTYSRIKKAIKRAIKS
ncbi:MAG: (2Fe-2S)-binding protein [Roseivirga sp.]|nr:(2Fe-2S)-binding protein [Roseivirga sp.]